MFGKDSKKKEFAVDHLEITEKEYKGIMEDKTEHWVNCPASIYGASICFLIVNREISLEYERDVYDLEHTSEISNEDQKKLDNLRYKQARFEGSFKYRALMLFAEIWVCFLVQGILIWHLWYQTPDPASLNNGFCYVKQTLQVGAITTLTLWTISNYTDIWLELRCYWSRACKFDNCHLTPHLFIIST